MRSLLEKNKNYCEIKTRGNYIWLYVTVPRSYYYSLNLHLELKSKNKNETHIKRVILPRL
jgi:hypothetical protein